MKSSNRVGTFPFFDLPREIRDDIYIRTMCISDDDYIWLAPRGVVLPKRGPGSETTPERCYSYRDIVSLFTISRQFRDESLPIFWTRNRCRIHNHINFVPTITLPIRADETIDFVGPSGMMYLQTLEVSISCIFVAHPRNNCGYRTDFGVTLRILLEMMPNLRELDLSIWCTTEVDGFPGDEDIRSALRKVAEGFLELSGHMYWESRSSVTYVQNTEYFNLIGSVTARPRHTKKRRMDAAEVPEAGIEPTLRLN